MTTQPGWYADPSGAPTQRFWDGHQWTPATALMAVPMLVATPAAESRSFIDRHPKMTGLGILWVILMAWHWWWLAPLLIVSFVAYRFTKYYRARNARLAADADYENSLFHQGNPVGTYGKYYRPATPAAQ